MRSIPLFFRRNPALLSLINFGKISKVEITSNETNGVESRIDFYEQTGVIRDVLQNHLLEVLVEILKLCRSLADSIKRSDFVSSLSLRKIITVQYEGYQEEVRNWTSGAVYNSSVPTFVHAVLSASGHSCFKEEMELSLTAGKKLQEKVTLAKITFENDGNTEVIFHIGGGSLPFPAVLFRGWPPDQILCPREGDSPKLVKYRLSSIGVEHNFYACKLGETFGNAYEDVIRDVCDGKKEFSADFNFVLNSWRFWDPWIV